MKIVDLLFQDSDNEGLSASPIVEEDIEEEVGYSYQDSADEDNLQPSDMVVLEFAKPKTSG